MGFYIGNPTDTAHLLIFKGEGNTRLSEHWVHQQESGFYSRISSNAAFVKKKHSICKATKILKGYY